MLDNAVAQRELEKLTAPVVLCTKATSVNGRSHFKYGKNVTSRIERPVVQDWGENGVLYIV